jgi:hypothetical protein
MAFVLKRPLLNQSLVFLGLVFWGASSAWADRYRAGFLEFDIPPGWTCHKEETDWVCEPIDAAQKSEALLIVVSKTRDEVDDTFDKYLQHLKEPREMRDLAGKPYKSEVKYVHENEITGQKWIDALHYGSEIQGFYSRYLATFKDNVAGLLTFSIAESAYKKHAIQLDKLVSSLTISFDKQTYDEIIKTAPQSLLGNRGGAPSTRLRPLPDSPSSDGIAKKGFNIDPDLIFQIILVLAVVGVVIFIVRRRR